MFLLGFKISTVPENTHNTEKNSKIPKNWKRKNLLWYTRGDTTIRTQKLFKSFASCRSLVWTFAMRRRAFIIQDKAQTLISESTSCQETIWIMTKRRKSPQVCKVPRQSVPNIQNAYFINWVHLLSASISQFSSENLNHK